MNKPYSFNEEQMNGIVEEIYTNNSKRMRKIKKRRQIVLTNK